jgi:hypothetical protein
MARVAEEARKTHFHSSLMMLVGAVYCSWMLLNTDASRTSTTLLRPARIAMLSRDAGRNEATATRIE